LKNGGGERAVGKEKKQKQQQERNPVQRGKGYEVKKRRSKNKEALTQGCFRTSPGTPTNASTPTPTPAK